MRKSLIASLGLHAAILIAALVVLPSPRMDVTPQQSIEVDISNIGDISKAMATSKDGETPKEKPAAKKTDTLTKTDPAEKIDKKVEKAVKEAVAAPPPEPPKPEPPKPEPKPEPPKPQPKPEPPPPDPNALNNLIKDTVKDIPDPKTEPAKKPETKPAEQKPPDKPKKPEKKQPKLNPDEIAAFLNKVDKSTAPGQPSNANGKPAKGEKTTQGADVQASADIISAMTAKLKECWTVPPGAREANIVVEVRFLLNPDGSVAGTPEVVNPNSDPLFDATARSAVSAVMDCQNYDFLPKDRYDLWKENQINFNPNMMFTN